ncbi:MAG: hypothetical protein IT458_12075 [Planctomycetes bacterium]|nr:hypothetical protein [Planctomycetota bacterium]
MLHRLVQDPQAAPAGDAAVVQEEAFRFLALPELWVVALILVPAVVVFAWWSYGGLKRLEPRTRAVLATLRGLAIAVCLLALFQPAWETVRYTKVRTQVHILVDDSASMRRKDAYPDATERDQLAAAGVTGAPDQYTRAEIVARVLERPGGLIESLRKDHEVRLFRFERQPLPVGTLGELQTKGPRTPLGDALDLHLATVGTANVDAVMLVSDGRSNSGGNPVEVAARYQAADVPIFTLGVGDPNPPRNVRLTGPPGPKEALKREEVAFDVTVSGEGVKGRSVTVTLQGGLAGGGMLTLASAPATLGDDGAPVKVRLYHAFEEAGDWTLRFEASGLEGETTLDDNADTRFLRVLDERIRVLYIDDLPRWEYRYLQYALRRVDPSIEMQAYLFDASRDFLQEASDQLEPLRDLPRTKEQLFAYHVILLGDVPPERLGTTEEKVTEWLQWLLEFAEFGGGVGFVYGEGAMPERYRGTPLEDLLPVVLEDPAEVQRLAQPRTQMFVPRLDNPVRPHDIALLRRDPEANTRLWHDGFEGLFVYHPVQQPKAGAEVILRHPSDENRFGKRVLMAAGYYPRGRTFFSATDETWRWRKPYGERYHDMFWRNVVRWLAGGRLQRRDDLVELRLDKVIVETGEAVKANLVLRTKDFKPSQATEATVFLRRADGKPQRRTLRAVPGEEGAYQGAFTMDEPGTVSWLVFANDNPADKVLAREDVLVKVPDREMAQSSQDRAMLEQIAAASKGGRHLFVGRADELAAELKGRKAFEHEVDRVTRPVWDTIWTLLVVLSLLAAEWLLRKGARLV